ncbi:hypothetical protein Hdeb2414_s0024g00655051 [Helianthus debilis subsp. tardiflorus]
MDLFEYANIFVQSLLGSSDPLRGSGCSDLEAMKTLLKDYQKSRSDGLTRLMHGRLFESIQNGPKFQRWVKLRQSFRQEKKAIEIR